MNNLIDEDPMVVQETLVFVEKLAKKDTFLNDKSSRKDLATLPN